MELDAIRKRIAGLLDLSGQGKNTRLTHLILFLGILGMLLIGLSECGMDTQSSVAPHPSAQSTSQTTAEALEPQLLRILEKMDGVGNVEIMITLEDSGESYYSTEDKTEGDTESVYNTDGSLGSVQSRRSAEQEYLLVENSDGRREALLLSHSEPQVKGVIVICDGADKATVREAVTEAVCTVLHINSTRVYVAKAKAEK